MIDHVRDLESVRSATERLLTAAAKLDNAGVTDQSRLPGWTRVMSSPTSPATRTHS